MNSDLSYKLLKYLVQGAIIYLLFKYVPKEPMNDKDIIIITSIVILSCVVFENVYGLYFKNDNKQITQPSCTSQCAIPKQEVKKEQDQTEHLENVSADTKSVSSVLSTGSSLVSSLASVAATASQSSGASDQSTQNQQRNDVQMPRNLDGSYTIKPVRDPQTEAKGSRSEDGTLNDEMAYNYRDYNTLYVDPNEGSFETGYSILPPKDWFPVPPHPPVCVSEKVCPVCPVYTNGTNLDLKEWNDSRRITPPDNINVNVVREKLNSGR